MKENIDDILEYTDKFQENALTDTIGKIANSGANAVKNVVNSAVSNHRQQQAASKTAKGNQEAAKVLTDLRNKYQNIMNKEKDSVAKQTYINFINQLNNITTELQKVENIEMTTNNQESVNSADNSKAADQPSNSNNNEQSDSNDNQDSQENQESQKNQPPKNNSDAINLINQSDRNLTEKLKNILKNTVSDKSQLSSMINDIKTAFAAHISNLQKAKESIDLEIFRLKETNLFSNETLALIRENNLNRLNNLI